LVYTLISYFVTIHLRILLWLTGYHLGINFWLFPNYFTSFKDPRKILWPLISVEKRDDQFNIGNLVFRILSAGLITYLVYQFFQDEKNIEDLKDIKGGI